MTEYWFARRFPAGNPRSAMAPVSRAGTLVALSFVVAMIVGAALFAALAIVGLFILGLIAFVVFAVAGAGFFIYLGVKKGDPVHTVADYRAGRVRHSA